jgi:hypothetical protein
MKKNNFILMVLFLVSVCFSVQPLSAQEKTKEEKENELKLQQTIDEQKKALLEQQKALDIQSQTIKKAMQDSTLYKIRNSGNLNLPRTRVRINGTQGGPDQSFIMSPGVDFQGYSRFFVGEGDSERTTWDFSKQVKESTFSRQYSFDVEKSSHTVTMSVMGDCKAGEIRIKILMPGGKTYSDVVIDESGNLNWRKSFNISEAENKDKAGEWNFKIEAEKASGYFRISLQTY